MIYRHFLIKSKKEHCSMRFRANHQWSCLSWLFFKLQNCETINCFTLMLIFYFFFFSSTTFKTRKGLGSLQIYLFSVGKWFYTVLCQNVKLRNEKKTINDFLNFFFFFIEEIFYVLRLILLIRINYVLGWTYEQF